MSASLWHRWAHRLDHREPAHGLAILRMGMGFVLVFELVSVARLGLIELLWLGTEAGGYRDYQTTGSWLVNALGGPSPSLIYTLAGLGITAGIALMVGVLPRLAALVGLQVFLALAWVNTHSGGSYDPLITNLLWLLVLADSASTGSLTARLRTGTWWPDTPTTAWPRYLVIGQMVTLYTSTGLQKVSASWVPGGDLSALYYILQQPTWQRTDMTAVASIYPLTQLATLVTWLFEVGAPVLIVAFWFRATADRPGVLRHWFNRLDIRFWWLAVGVVMHVGIMATMDVGTFSMVCLATYPCFFHADELKRFGRFLARRPQLPQPSPRGTTHLPAE